jgi:hypothetical protein
MRGKSILCKLLQTRDTSVEYFYRSLVALNRKLDNIAPTEYQIDSAPHPSGTFLRLIVTSRHPEEKVMRGELYVDEIDGLDTPVAYSFRWQTVASETRFFASLQSIFSLAPDIVHSTLPPVLAVRSITGDEPPPTEGLLYFTNIGVFSVPLKETFLSLTRGGRIAERLKQTMADTSRTLADKIEIQAVRLQTDFGDFQLDIANDDAGIREVFVKSRARRYSRIAFA